MLAVQVRQRARLAYLLEAVRVNDACSSVRPGYACTLHLVVQHLEVKANTLAPKVAVREAEGKALCEVLEVWDGLEDVAGADLLRVRMRGPLIAHATAEHAFVVDPMHLHHNLRDRDAGIHKGDPRL